MVIFSWIVGVLLLNYVSWTAFTYFAIRYLYKPQEVDSMEEMPLWAILLLGLPISIFCPIAEVISKTKSPHAKVAEIARRHRQQDHDVTYQLEKHLLDKK